MDLVTPDIGLIFWQSVVFILLVVVLSLYVWKPIIKGIKERERTIESSLQAAKKAKEEMEQIQSDNEYLLQEARKERNSILQEAKKEASIAIEEAKKETSILTERMLQEARASIEAEKRGAIGQLKQVVSDISLEIAEKILQEKLSNETSQKQLIDKLVKEIKVN